MINATIKTTMNATINRLLTPLFLLLPLGVHAQATNDRSSFLDASQVPDGAFLPAPPDSSSVAYLNDINRYEWGKSQRKTDRGVTADFDAYWQTDSMMIGFAPYLGFTITRKDMPQTFKLLSMVSEDAENGVQGAKKKYMRHRPYAVFGEQPSGGSKYMQITSGSYPSGHAARGWATALVLSELLPDRANGVLTRGFDYGESRVITGYHFQSDVDAARLAASAVAVRLQSVPAFKQQFDLARKEIAALPGDIKTTRVEHVGKLEKKAKQAFQGMAIYKDYLVSLQNTGMARIYHLPDMAAVTDTFALGSKHKYNHANVAAFGTEKYNPADVFPLLYVSQCNVHEVNGMRDACYVERISLDGKSELVQSIALDEHNKYFGHAVQWTIDQEHNILIGYGNTKANTIPGNRFRVVRFHLPKLADGKVVHLNMKDAIDNVIIQDYDARYPSISISQGAVYKDGCLYLPTGFGTTLRSSVLYVWDINKRRLRSILDLQSQLPHEMEDADFFKGQLYIQCNGGAGVVKLVK